jgi:hypothetical protein
MTHVPALKIALELMHSPWRARFARTTPLPVDVEILLRIAAGDERAIGQATESVGRSREVVCDAAAFFVEQILLYPDADSYRVLGANPEATNGELRHNMALLLRWLHPDLDHRGERSVFAARVTRAWNDLKTRERRDAYDRLKRKAPVNKSHRRKRKGAAHIISKKQEPHRRAPSRGRKTNYSVSPRSLNISRDSRSFMRRVLLFLLSRAAH